MIRRWLTFNGVGLLGFAVQLGALALLISWCGWHHLAATAVAVEAAVLHNFIWHQRVTWRDRGAGSARTVLTRLWRFHLLNGAVSLAGNLAIVALLTGAFDMHPVPANVAAVLACSLVNFFGSEVLVFRTAAAVLLVLLSPAALRPVTAESVVMAELLPHTVAAWKKYEKLVDERHASATASGQPFFAHDAYGREKDWREKTMAGDVQMFQAGKPGPSVEEIDVPDGRIHHWAGAIFIPNTTLDAVLLRIQDNSGKEAGAYKEVIDSRLLERNGNRLRVYMRIQRDATITTVTYNTEHDVLYRTLGDRRATQRSTATKINELENAGTPHEREKPQGKDSGYLWRWSAYWRYEQVTGGVLIECESVSLSRDVPFVVRPIVNPIANRLARESLRGTLTTLRTLLTSGRTGTGQR